jgi:hypothetical protein
MMEWKTFCCPFHAPENLPNYPQLFSFSATCGTQSIFPQLASALNAYRMDGFDLSLLIISPRFCLVQQKKNENPCAFINVERSLFLILSDCHLMLVFLSHPVHFQIYVPVQLLLYHQRYALFSLFDCWLFIRVHIFHLLWLNEDRMEKEVGERQSIYTWNVQWKVHEKPMKKNPSELV